MNTKFADKVFRVIFVIAFVLGMVSMPSTRAAATVGNLDPNFGLGGKQITDWDFGGYGSAVAVQDDGRIIVGGCIWNGATYDFGLVRYNINGSLDDTFSEDGKQTTDIGENDCIQDIALQTDGKLIVGGTGNINYVTIARYDLDGSLDSTFGINGIATIHYFGTTDDARALAIQPDGKIIVVGNTRIDFSGSSTYEFALARFNPDGSLDNDFGVQGKVITDFGGNDDWGQGVFVQPDGKIIAVGVTCIPNYCSFASARYNLDGSLDVAFGIDGKVITDFPEGGEAKAVIVQSDEKIVVAGTDFGRGFALARYDTDGNLDDSFGIGGIIVTQMVSRIGNGTEGTSIALLPDDKILVAGYGDEDFALVLYNPDGSLDNTFGIGGKLTTDFGANDTARSMTIQGDGRIIVAGSTDNSPGNVDFAIARYVTTNLPPIANAGGPYTAITGDSIVLNATSSFDPNGDALTYEWDLDSDSEYGDATGVTTTTVFNQAGEYTIGLRVTDTFGLTGTDTAIVTVSQPASNPIIWGVTASNDWINGMDWQKNGSVQVSIDNPSTPQNPDSTTTQNTDINGNFSYQAQYDISVGSVISVTDGNKTKQVTVSNFEVTGIDVNADTISGIGTPNANAAIWLLNWWEPFVIDSSGHWQVNLAGKKDITTEPEDQGFAIEQDSDGDGTQSNWRLPTFTARLVEDRIYSYGWPLGIPVTLSIDDQNIPGSPDYTDTQTAVPAGWSLSQVMFDLGDAIILEPGILVTVTNGMMTKTLMITDFLVTGVDTDADTVFGTAHPGADVSSYICEQNICAFRHITADGGGNWVADFSVLGEGSDEQNLFDIQPGTHSWAGERDEDGDETSLMWRVPYIQASIDRPRHSVDGYDWPLDSSVTLTIDNPGNGTGIDFTDIQNAGQAQWDPNGTQVQFNLDDFWLETGAIVTLTDGTITQTHTVAYLDITDVDTTTDRIYGKASPGSTVQVESPHRSRRNVIADQSGNWIADFSTPGAGNDEQSLDDIQEGKGFTTRQYGEGSNRTRLYWRVPDYKVIAYPDEDVIAATDFWPGTPVTITVDDPDNGVGVDLTRSGVVDTETGGWNCQTWWGYCFVLDLREEFDVQPGQLITITDVTHTVSHIVTTLLITNVDFAASTVAGTAEPLSDIYLELWPSCGQRQLSADEYGSWLEDFSIPGDEDFEQETCDFSIDELRDIVAYQGSGEGETWVGKYMPYPGFEVVLGSNNINGWDWPLGATLTLEVDDPSTPVNPDYAGSAVVGPASWDPNKPFFEAVTTGYDIKPGDIVTVTDGARIKSTIVADIVINSIDVGTDTISGTAPPEAEVHVISDDGPERITNADTLGNWSVDFSVEQDGNPVLNLIFGSAGVLSAIDDDGDRTYTGWNAPDDSDGDGVPDSEDNAPNDYNPDQGNVDGDNTADVLDPCPDDATDSCNTNGSAAGVMGEQGGTITTPNGKASLNIPAGSVHEEVSLTITDMGSGYELTSDQGSMMIVHSYSIQPNGTQFDPPATIIFRWDDADHDGIVDGTTVQEADLLLVKDGIVIASSCENNPSCNMNADELTVEVSSLSLFALAVPIEWTLKGFYQPVDMNGVYNNVKGGSTVPLKFEIFADTNELTEISYIKSLTYAQTSCDANAVTDEVETTATGGTSLRYADGQFIYNWKTPKSAGMCYRVTMTTIDGSTLMAYFKLK